MKEKENCIGKYNDLAFKLSKETTKNTAHLSILHRNSLIVKLARLFILFMDL